MSGSSDTQHDGDFYKFLIPALLGALAFMTFCVIGGFINGNL